jgi:hypothetical protein
MMIKKNYIKKKNKAIKWLSELNKIYSKEIPILLKFNWFSEIDDYSESDLLDPFTVSSIKYVQIK